MTIIRSHKGRVVDVSQILAQNSKMVACGNMKINARGDLLGDGGKIIKTREQLAVEYFDKNPKAVEHVVSSLNSPINDMVNGKVNPQTEQPSSQPIVQKASKSSLDSLELEDVVDEEFEPKQKTKSKGKV